MGVRVLLQLPWRLCRYRTSRIFLHKRGPSLHAPLPTANSPCCFKFAWLCRRLAMQTTGSLTYQHRVVGQAQQPQTAPPSSSPQCASIHLIESQLDGRLATLARFRIGQVVPMNTPRCRLKKLSCFHFFRITFAWV